MAYPADPMAKRRLKTITRTKPASRSETSERTAPRWRVLLHNDDVSDMELVVQALQQVFGFGTADARAVMSEAHCTGVALCKIEGRPDAEKHRDGLRSFGLTATIEPDRS